MDNKLIEDKNLFLNFSEYFDIILKSWTAFRLALDSCPECLDDYIEFQDEDGNTNEELEIIDVIKQVKKDIFNCLILNKSNQIYEISDYLFDLIQYFEVELDDQSDREIAKILISLFSDLKNNNNETINKIIETDKKLQNRKYEIEFPIVELEENKENDDVKKNKEEVKKENNQMEVDEEGFSVVKKKNNRFQENK